MIKLVGKKSILPKISKCYIARSFDLWVQGALDIFTLVINYKGLIGSQNMLLLVCSKQQKLLVEL